MTDEPEDPPGAGSDRSGLVAGEAAARARFGDGPALFSADVPAPRHPHVGPLLPHRRLAFHTGAGRDDDEARGAGPDASSGALVLAPRHLPARPGDDLARAWQRAGAATRQGVEVALEWTTRTVVSAVAAVGAAATAVVTLIFGPERTAALPEGRRR